MTNTGLIRRFLGPRVLLFLTAGIAIGVSLFCVEMGFAYSLQAFLVCLKVAPAGATTRTAGMLSSLGLYPVLSFIFCVGLIRGGLNWAQVYTQGAAAEEFRYLQRSRVLRWAFVSDSMGIHEAIFLFETRVVQGASAINCVQGLAVQITSLLLVLGALIWISPRLSIAVVAAMILLFMPVRIADRRILESATVQSNSLMSMSRKLIDSVKNLLLIQIYGTQDIEERQAQGFLSNYREHALRLYKVSGMKYALPQFVGMVLVCVITLAAHDHAGLAPGVLVSYFYLVVQLLQGLAGLNITVTGAVGAWPESVRLYQWWERNAHDGPNPPRRKVLSLAKRPADAKPVGWQLDGVSFSYPDSSVNVLENLTVRLAPGQVLAITGSSGAGKSTLLNLLLGGLTPTRGDISIILPSGAREALEPYRSHLLPLIGYVGPENFLLEGTLWNNLVYGLQEQPSQADMDAALETAECDFIEGLANGLQYRLTEQGQGLSAGQKQRLALARALLRKPTVLILDEATSNLDVETEERLVETFARLKGEMTIVAATHRRALLRIADHRLSLGTDSREASGVPG